MKPERDYDKLEDAEFVLCDICRFHQYGECQKKESLLNSTYPSEWDCLGGLYGICSSFKGPSVAIQPDKFAELMKKYVNKTTLEPDMGLMKGDDVLRFRLEFLMCEMLTELGYGDGAKIFKDIGFETPF